MQVEPTPDLARRLERLERRQRLQLGALVACGAALLAAARAPTPEVLEAETVRARAVQMVDAEGRVRAELAIDADGSAGLFVRDPEGEPRAVVVHDESQSALYLMDDAGTIRVGAAQFAHGGGGFALHGPESKGGAILYLKGEGSLSFHDPDGELTLRLPD